jgi:hypothetical protein
MTRRLTVSMERLRAAYPRRLAKEGQFGGKLAHPDLRAVMTRNPGTPCCVQITHALNLCGEVVPAAMYPRAWRAPDGNMFEGRKLHYILAVDELEHYLTHTYGPAELVNRTADGKKRTVPQIKTHLGGRTGILLMFDAVTGIHAELWTGTGFHQTDMAVDHLLGLARLPFWDCGPAQWLQDYMGTA